MVRRNSACVTSELDVNVVFEEENEEAVGVSDLPFHIHGKLALAVGVAEVVPALRPRVGTITHPDALAVHLADARVAISLG